MNMASIVRIVSRRTHLPSSAEALLMPELDALLDEGADLAVGKRSSTELHAEATPFDQLLSPEQHPLLSFGGGGSEAKLLTCCRRTPLGEQLLDIALLSVPPMERITAAAGRWVDAIATVDSYLLLVRVVGRRRLAVIARPAVDPVVEDLPE